MMRTLRALAAGLLLIGLVVGIPIGLANLGGSLLPSSWPTWDQIRLLLTSPLSGNLVIGALIVIGWIAWASFTIAVLAEVAALLRGRRPPRLPALGAQQRLAAVLLAAIVLAVTAEPASTAAARPLEPTTTPATSIAAPLERETTTTPTEPDDTTDSAIAQTCVVQPGDTLWDLAATHLGDGQRWREIAHLNYGRTQPDGSALTDAHWIEPGWTLILPATQQATATHEADTPNTEHLVTVVAGDTLYDIAQEELGDGERYPEIVDATQHLVQPSGAHLTDPDLIYPGWQVVIPADAVDQPSSSVVSAADESPTPEPDPAPDDISTEPLQIDTSQVPTAVAPTAAPAQSVGSEASPDQPTRELASVADAGGAADSHPSAPLALRTAGGMGALLAAGIAGLVLARRRHTARTLPPGARLDLPHADSPAAAFDQELHAVAAPIGRDAVNLALRDLAAHADSAGQQPPSLLFARYAGDGSELQVYLTKPADLPHPWVHSDNRQIWSITEADLTGQVAPRVDPETVLAPYPALVGLGIGDQDTHLLVDLARMRHLDLRGDHETAHGVIAALILELVTSDWADDLQVTIVGRHRDLADALASPRVLLLESPGAALDRLEPLFDVAGEHGSWQWPPEVVFFAAELSEPDRDRVATLLDRSPSGLAIVTIGADLGAAAIDLAADTLEATLLPSGMPLQVQHLSPTEYTQVVASLDVRCVPGPTWTQTLATAAEPNVGTLPDPDPTERLEPVEEAEQALFNVERTAPVVRILGPVELVGTDTAVLSGTIGHLHAAVEMTAYLSLHDGATANQLTTALWPNQDIKPATRHSAISRTRRLLGTTPQGHARLEGETTGGQAATRYYLTDVASDWEEFTRLRGPDPSLTPLGDLRRAMALVRGAPFSQVRDGVGRVRANRYLWSDTLGLEITASIIDVACEAARRALLDGRPRLAAEVADAGLRASGDYERLWRYAIRARIQTGDHDAVADLVDALTQRLTELDVDPEPETNTLLDDVAAATRQVAS